MKKGLIIAAICFAVMIIALPFACTEVDAGKESVKITEEVISGNPAAAEGIKLNMATHWKGHMLWNIQYTVGGGETVSDFEFEPNEVTWERKKDENIFIDYVTNYGTVMSGNVRQSQVVLDDISLSEVVKAVADRTTPGTENTELIKLADYYEYYPITICINGGNHDVNYSNDKEEAVFTELFHIGISEDDVYKVRITKDSAGFVTGFNIRMPDLREEGWTTEDAEAFGKNGCYYTYACTDWKTGEYIERGENRGIFYIPYKKDGNRTTIAKDKIEKVYELEDGEIPVDMLLDEENSRLYLLTRDGENFNMYVYSLNGYVPVLEISFAVDKGGDNRAPAVMSLESGGILIKWGDNRFAFISNKNGEHELWCNGTFPDASSDWGKTFPDEHAAWFYGERLVLAAFKEWYGADVQLVVYDREGQKYYGIYHNSAATADARFYEKMSSDKIVPQGGTGGLSRANGVEYVPIWLSE